MRAPRLTSSWGLFRRHRHASGSSSPARIKYSTATQTSSATPLEIRVQSKKAFKTPPTPPTGVKVPKLLFPLSFRDSLSQWWHPKDLAEAEKALLQFGNVDVDNNPSVSSIDTMVGPKRFINELQFEGPKIDGKENKHIVLIHGYGAAKGFFYRNFNAIGTMPGYTLHALDLLGYGRSSRPKFRVKAKTLQDGVNAAENWFVDSLEEWRKARGIESFDFMAHSLGAYVGCAYAVRMPERVNKLMLISPAGVNRTADAIPADILGSIDPYDPSADEHREIPRWFAWLWERNMSPFAIIRNTGPWGPKLASAWSHRRFQLVSDEERDALHLYTYGIFSGKGSGEYALNYLLAPGARGRWPLAERVKDLKCPSLWLYGDQDWMDIRGGYEAARQIKKHHGVAQVVEVSDAGHHIYLDNEKEFNRITQKFITEFPSLDTSKLRSAASPVIKAVNELEKVRGRVEVAS